MKDSYRDRGYRGVVDLMPFGPNEYLLTRVAVLRAYRGQGAARELMATVLADADREGATLFLSADPDPDPDGSQRCLALEPLLSWYHRLGFQPGIDPDDPLALTRPPRNEEGTPE